MGEMYASLSGFGQVIFIVACISTGIFVIKATLMMFGIGVDDVDVPDADVPDDVTADVPAEIASGSLHFLTLHGIAAFFAVGSWATLVTLDKTGSNAISIVVGVIAGALMMVASAYMMRAMMRLQQSGNVNTTNAIGKIGEVYLRIPPMGKGRGKINVVLGGKECEYEAVSQDEEEIPYGTRVRVVDLQEEDDVMVVQRESEELE